MNSLGKVLVVFVTATSLGFAAFALSLVSGGPNWKAEAESAELTNDFVFATAGGEKPTYSVKSRRLNEAVGGSSPLLAEVVVAARKKQLENAKAKQAQLAKAVEDIKPVIAGLKQLIPQDEAGMKVRAEMLDKLLEQLNAAIKVASDEFTMKAGEIQQIRKTGQERREEAFRLKNQLELLRDDLFAAQTQQKALEDELVRLEENRNRLQRRETQLKQQVGSYE